MFYLYLVAFFVGLLLAVRIMFFGAERRRARRRDGIPLRRSEPAIAAFFVMFGIAGYLIGRHGSMSPIGVGGAAAGLALAWAALVTRLAIATARLQPEHDPEDPRYLLQGHVAVVTRTIPAAGEGMILLGQDDGHRTLRARAIDENAVEEGIEVCIERVDDGVALVELWALVEARL